MTEVTVIGGGIIGVCTALALQREGVSTLLIERGPIGGEATFGNCALMALSEIVPLAKPGVMKKLPGWILNPEGPLAIRPGHLPSALPWLFKFLRNARPHRVAQICHGLGMLTAHAQEDFDEVIEAAQIENIWAENEVLYLYDKKEQYLADRFSWQLRADEGYHTTELEGGALAGVESDVDTDGKFGLIAHGWRSFTDPQRLTRELAQHFTRLGGEILNAEVSRIESAASRPKCVHFTNGAQRDIDKLVIAAGCWAGRLLKDIGIRIPLAPLHGYHTDIADSGVSLSRPVLYASGGFVNTPVESGLRIAGTVEIAPLDPEPNFRRAEVLVEKAKRSLFPGLKSTHGSQWIGTRPFMPDTLPVIGPAPGVDNTWLAVGHGQLGITMGPTTGKLVSAMITGRSPVVDLAP
ncbi:MAG: FAD-dependent oxidoreductase, partial [Pseudomonadota bacterium]|nr:FAD-dependent oxidoreductase [Pseudomonadota bacterium]